MIASLYTFYHVTTRNRNSYFTTNTNRTKNKNGIVTEIKNILGYLLPLVICCVCLSSSSQACREVGQLCNYGRGTYCCRWLVCAGTGTCRKTKGINEPCKNSIQCSGILICGTDHECVIPGWGGLWRRYKSQMCVFGVVGVKGRTSYYPRKYE